MDAIVDIGSTRRPLAPPFHNNDKIRKVLVPQRLFGLFLIFDTNQMLSVLVHFFRRHVFHEIGHGIAFDGHGSRRPGGAGGRLGIDPCGVVHEIGGECWVFVLGILHVSGPLMDNGTNHFQMSQFLRTNIGVKSTSGWKNV